MFLLCLFRPVFAHADAVGLAGAPVAVSMLRPCPTCAVVTVSEVPGLVCLDCLSASFADGPYALAHEVLPSCPLCLVCFTVTTSCGASALVFVGGHVCFAVSCSDWYELRAVGPGTSAHGHGRDLPSGMLCLSCMSIGWRLSCTTRSRITRGYRW